MPGQRRALMAPIDDEIVPLGLARDRFLDRGFERLVVRREPQRGAQGGGVFLAEAHIERSVTAPPRRVAGCAEMGGGGGEEPEPPAGLLDLDVARRPAGAIIDLIE